MKRGRGPALTLALMLAAGCATQDGGARRDHAAVMQTLGAFRSAFLAEDYGRDGGVAGGGF